MVAGPLAAPAEVLPEVAAVHWRPRADDAKLRRDARLWTAATAAHVVPFVGTAIGLVLLEPLAAPVSLIALAKAWIIPELYAARGGNVVRAKARGDEAAERTALGLLGDLVGHAERERAAQTGLVLERGRLGVWLLAEAGALLVRPGGRRVFCYCVRAADPDLPSGDRIAHLLLALRADEEGFATVANVAFAGARWRVRRRIPAPMRPALDAAARLSVEPGPGDLGRLAHAAAA